MEGQISGQMAGRSFLTRSAEETMELGRQVARQLAPPVVVLLVGDLGAGKTTFAKGLVAGLGAAAEKEVTSPTFTLVQEYGSQQENALRVYHVDLYRIENQRDLETLGLGGPDGGAVRCNRRVGAETGRVVRDSLAGEPCHRGPHGGADGGDE